MSRTLTFMVLLALIGAVYAGKVEQGSVLFAADDPWGAYTVPASANMLGVTGKPPRPAEPNTLRNASPRKGRFIVKLPAGARNLKLKLTRHDFMFGTAYSPETASDVEWYQNMTASMFNAITPENTFKWFNYEVQPGNYSDARDRLDNLYLKFAQDHHIPHVRGHTLEWYRTQNFWGHELNCTDYSAALKERIVRDVTYFKGRFTQYDVFNEVIEHRGMLDKCDLWNTTFPEAFKLAHQADPDAKLCINDYSLIEAGFAPIMIQLIKDYLLANGAPIHCIGIQTHFTYDGINITRQKENLDLLAELGLDLYITEYSLFSTWKGPDGGPISFLDEETQANMTVELFKLWFEHPAVKGIVMWGFWEDNIWIKGAGAYNQDKTPKKVALAIQDLLTKEWTTEVRVRKPEGRTSFTGYYGRYEYRFTTSAGKVRKGTVHFGKGKGRGRRVTTLGRPKGPPVTSQVVR